MQAEAATSHVVGAQRIKALSPLGELGKTHG
ncbi:MAG: hypothetical protein RLZ29_764, partial [Actinomycetota bacterium]